MKKINFINNYLDQDTTLNGQASREDLKYYFQSIFIENNLDSNNPNIYEEILNKTKTKLFYPLTIVFIDDDDKEIYSGCCFTLNEMKESYTDISNSVNPWLGHDPWPDMEFYDNDKVIVTSDMDIAEEERIKIQCTKDELIRLYNDANDELKDFIEVFYEYLKTEHPIIADAIHEGLKKCLL